VPPRFRRWAPTSAPSGPGTCSSSAATSRGIRPDEVVLGKLGADLTIDDGRAAARLAAISALNTLRHELGTLDAVRRIVSLRGVVNATPDFTAHTQVIDGASDVFVEVFGDAGHHARLAVGVSSLPANLALEIELLVELDVATTPGSRPR